MCVSLRGCQQNRGKKKTRSIAGGSLEIVCCFNSHNLPRPARGGREGCGRFKARCNHETDLNFSGTVLQVNMPRMTVIPHASDSMTALGRVLPVVWGGKQTSFSICKSSACQIRSALKCACHPVPARTPQRNAGAVYSTIAINEQPRRDFRAISCTRRFEQRHRSPERSLSPQGFRWLRTSKLTRTPVRQSSLP